jgi:peptidoglycan hydrolase FlgJ
MAAPLATDLSGLSTAAFTGLTRKGAPTSHAKARTTAQDFEAVFLNTMFSQMFTAIGKEGPLGDGQGVGVWRSFLTDEYAKSFARAGGIGLADDVYRSLIAQQEVK